MNAIITNASTKVIFAVSDPDDAYYFARRSGQIVIPAFSQSSSRSQTGESTGESLAWDQAGQKARAWWKESVDSVNSHDIIV